MANTKYTQCHICKEINLLPDNDFLGKRVGPKYILAKDQQEEEPNKTYVAEQVWVCQVDLLVEAGHVGRLVGVAGAVGAPVGATGSVDCL